MNSAHSFSIMIKGDLDTTYLEARRFLLTGRFDGQFDKQSFSGFCRRIIEVLINVFTVN